MKFPNIFKGKKTHERSINTSAGKAKLKFIGAEQDSEHFQKELDQVNTKIEQKKQK